MHNTTRSLTNSFLNIFSVLLSITMVLITSFLEIEYLSLIFLFYSIYMIWILYYQQKIFSLIYGLYLTISHLGIFFVGVFLDDPLRSYTSTTNTSWFYLLNTEQALQMSIYFITFFFIASVLFKVKGQKIEFQNRDYTINAKKYYYFNVSIVILLLCFSYVLLTGVTGTIDYLGGYTNFRLSILNSSTYPWFIFCLSISLSMYTLFYEKEYKSRYIGLIFIIGITTLMLYTGNRGEVLYPFASSISILIIRKKVRLKGLLILFPLILLLIQFVKIFRNNHFAFFFEAPIVEMGYTIRPFIFTLSWFNNYGENHSFGMSYFAPIINMLSNFIPGLGSIDYELVPYGFRHRLPTMGYSVISEGYYNFAYLGLLLIPILIAWIIKVINESIYMDNNYYVISGILIALYSLLINNIRNAFSFIPGQFLMIVLLFVLIESLWRILKKKRSGLN